MAYWSLLIVGVFAISTRVDGQKVLEESPTVQIPQGLLSGATDSTADGTKYYKFLGIPYAKPPVGDLRFAAPENPESWSGVRNATSFGSTCYQTGQPGGSEDCLFLNVFTPQLPTSRGSETSLLPVMVYIHGGAFVAGSGNLSPGHLMDYGLVIVSINYRLNVFGFLSINGTNAPGNAGLKDQTAALRWVQKNIARFGGEPRNVTIFGASAGGASVHYNILSPLSRGLFHRAISESGSALNPWAFFKNTEARAYRVAEILGNKTSSAVELLSVLRATPAEKLNSVLTRVLTAEELKPLLLFPFVPSLEFPSEEERFLPHEPSYIEKNGLFNKVPYITGVTKYESSMFITLKLLANPTYWQDINDDLEQVVPLDLGLTKGSEKSLEVAQKVKLFYFGDKAISNETISQFTDLQTDLLFVTGVVQATRAQVEHSTSATYNYQFVYSVAYHTMEFNYVTYTGKVRGQSSDEAKLARLLGGLWTNFAKTGVPSVEEDVEDAVVWRPSQDNSSYLEIDVIPSLKSHLEKERMDFWRDIYNHYSDYTPTFSE